MKKLILLTGILIICLNGIAQSGISTECVNCKYNEISKINLSSAIGTYNVASGQTSFASGTECSAIGDYSTALGKNSIASGISSFAVGQEVQAAGDYNIAIGKSSISNGIGSFSFGIHANSSEIGSHAIGNYLLSNGAFAMVLGTGDGVSGLLENQISHSLMIGFYSNKPTFFVGPSNGSNTSGKIGIGNITQPEAKLHIKADASENATLFLQSSDWNSKYAEIQLGTTENAIKAEKDIGLTFKTEENYLFNDGNVGIGTDEPEHLLDVNGDIKFSGQLYDANGIFETTKWVNNGSNIYYNQGNVGIGTPNPIAQLELADFGTAGSMNLKIGNDVYLSDIDNGNTLGILGCQDNTVGAIKLGLTGPKLYGENGILGIGTANLDANYILNVSGKILAEELKIQDVVGADFVFYDDYKLPSLEDVEKFIEQNDHLPEIPSAEEMKTNGVEIGDLQIKLLQKVEELTLYIIEQQKEIEKLKEKVGR